ncbi:hypothetical protein NQ318_005499 [Aromia moschata]|uniref:Secreted protein n=1 Tax=Aromia moschata TaxID=1265417 RepID=A0AAV8YD47_9CUCU|nr:hypothetical protein NQ318_005499 [Aromia moschata]
MHIVTKMFSISKLIVIMCLYNGLATMDYMQCTENVYSYLDLRTKIFRPCGHGNRINVFYQMLTKSDRILVVESRNNQRDSFHPCPSYLAGFSPRAGDSFLVVFRTYRGASAGTAVASIVRPRIGIARSGPAPRNNKARYAANQITG